MSNLPPPSVPPPPGPPSGYGPPGYSPPTGASPPPPGYTPQGYYQRPRGTPPQSIDGPFYSAGLSILLFARCEPAAHVLADGLRLLETVDLRAQLPSLRMPSLWLAGRRDRLVDPRAMRMAAEMTPDAVFAQVEHAGHAPFLTHADEVAKYIIDFAESLHRHPREGGDPATFATLSEMPKTLGSRLRGNDVSGWEDP